MVDLSFYLQKVETICQKQRGKLRKLKQPIVESSRLRKLPERFRYEQLGCPCIVYPFVVVYFANTRSILMLHVHSGITYLVRYCESAGVNI